MPIAVSKDEGRDLVAELVARFEENRTYYCTSAFVETATRTQFITPLLEALGWDVDDRQGLGPRSEVQVENSFTVEPGVAGEEDWDQDLTEEELAERISHMRYPDYVIRPELVERFIVEAKKPSVNLASKAPAFQAKTYAWSRRLPIATLTNFKELRVFDGRFRPEYQRSNANLLAALDLRCEDFVSSWDNLWDLLSREAVLGGSLDRFIVANPSRGARAVDRAFLDELDSWRIEVAIDLHRGNPDLDRWELAEATQRILDRVIFIRVMEDREILGQIVLRRYARQSDSYRRLAQEFRRLDVRYNGQLFAEHFSERLELSDGLFQRLLADLYPPRSPYRFDVVGSDLLGSVYERFLGQEIAVDPEGQVRVELKPEVRHGGGVYYTPRWVVDRIVEKVVGPLVEGKRPAAVANVRILDPACGSGAFLLGAFDHLIKWHERYYDQHPTEDPRAHFVTVDGRRHLTADMKAQILKNSIFGVDIDPQAVEVTQMNLYLALLEHENRTTLETQQRLFDQAYLPPLNRNVRCGNSLLLESDLPPGTLLGDEDIELRRRINPFEWRDSRDGFGEVFTQRNGFDAIVGNPPYTRVQVLRAIRPEEADAYQARYSSASEGSFDIASLFIERGLELLRPDGRLGYIVSRQFAETAAGRPLRELLANGRHVKEIVDFTDGFVFEEVSAYTMLLTLGRAPSPSYRLTRVSAPPSNSALATAEAAGSKFTWVKPSSTLGAAEWDLESPAEAELLRRLARDNPTLADVCGDTVFQGVVTGADFVFCLDDLGPHENDPSLRKVRHRRTAAEAVVEESLIRPVLAGRSDIQRFSHRDAREVLLLPYAREDATQRFELLQGAKLQTDYPHTWSWLCLQRAELEGRTGTWTEHNWWSYSRRQNLERFEERKVLVPYMLDYSCAWLDEGRHFFVNVTTGGYGIPITDSAEGRYLCALLNSRLLSWALRLYSRAFHGGWFAARKGNLVRLPIADVNADTKATIVSLFDMCVETKADVEQARSDQDRTLRERAYAEAVRRFDLAVEEAFGVTESERGVLELGT